MLPGLVLRARASLCDCVGTYRSCVPGVGGRGVDWWAGAASVGAVAAESISINTGPKGFFFISYLRKAVQYTRCTVLLLSVIY